MHYHRWLVHGSVDRPSSLLPWPRNLVMRLTFMPPDRMPTGCIEFNGYRCADGYGQVWDGARTLGAHVAAWQILVGPVTEGHHLHHLCENPPCVNPTHLESVTPEEHRKRHLKTHCIHGHEFTPETTLVLRSGARTCRICKRSQERERRRRKREDAHAEQRAVV